VIALAPFAGIEAAAGATPPWTDPRLAAVLLFLAVVPSLGAYYVYGRLISRAGPATAGLSMFLVPVYAALLAWPLLGETPQLFHAYGFVMILLGMKLASTRLRARAATAAAPRVKPGRPAAATLPAVADQRPVPWAAMTSCATLRGASA